jgi:hypothetical protein
MMEWEGGNIMTIWTKNNSQKRNWQLQLQRQHLQFAETECGSGKRKKRELCTAVAQRQWLNCRQWSGGGILLYGPKQQSKTLLAAAAALAASAVAGGRTWQWQNAAAAIAEAAAGAQQQQSGVWLVCQ